VPLLVLSSSGTPCLTCLVAAAAIAAAVSASIAAASAVAPVAASISAAVAPFAAAAIVAAGGACGGLAAGPGAREGRVEDSLQVGRLERAAEFVDLDDGVWFRLLVERDGKLLNVFPDGVVGRDDQRVGDSIERAPSNDIFIGADF
jgi:hypothetical protein